MTERTELWQVMAVCPPGPDHDQAWHQSFKMPAGVDHDGALDFALSSKLEFPFHGSPCPTHGPDRMQWAIRKLVTTVEDFEEIP